MLDELVQPLTTEKQRAFPTALAELDCRPGDVLPLAAPLGAVDDLP